ncbi:type I polyketide synthase [Paenibacillus lentus]|uniref:SDR family NAD(P)-dependent oxidoreductase n=1 Tax=Paenibacillus lentus TaxID=1338368 RepID=A0A3Q8SDV8_9BACL|nr:type I polyketide synthase [Paenibacillus lentus]AZK48521.1 SDR family NAD(P)-dependent oxidoreductase [Paenibacillus lentus]
MSTNNNMYEGNGLEIAVVGMAGRFPGAKNIEEFWENLRNGKESITFFTDEELLAGGVDPEMLKHPQYVKAKAMLEDVESFDESFFDYTPREAELLDPQVRLFHECAWEALEQAGYSPDSEEQLVGVYAGASSNTYWVAGQAMAARHSSDHFQILQLNNPSFTTRVSYKLNLKGPSVSVQTACSTSLVAIHLACQGLLGGECDLALAGGVSINLPRTTGYLYQEGMIQSPDGHCRPFDAEANGTLFGDGIGVVVLKRLNDALADGDTIHAIVKGSAINNDGNRKVGYTAPSTMGQVEVIRAAHQMAEVPPESIGYIEAHGTGTSLGDPIEVEALQLAFTGSSQGSCRIGSIKSNIGHLDAAAGVASFIKTVLMLKHKQIPPTLHFQRPNPKIDFTNSPFVVNTKLTSWDKTNGYLRAGVSSFGIGGTNAHVVLEEAPMQRKGSSSRSAKLMVLSAATETGLKQAAHNLAEYLRHNQETDLADVAYTLQTGRKKFRYRRAVVCRDHEEALHLLMLDEIDNSGWIGESTQEQAKVTFLFPGQGSEYVNMGLGLYQTEPIFRQQLDRCCEFIVSRGGDDLRKHLFGSGTNEKSDAAASYKEEAKSEASVDSDEYKVKPARLEDGSLSLFVFEYALAKLLMFWGIQPRAMLGYNAGEYVSAVLAGVLTLEDALELLMLRSRLLNTRSDRARHDNLQPEEKAGSGRQSIEEVLSAFTDSELQIFSNQMNQISLSAPDIPYLSTVTGAWITAEEATSPAYWVHQLQAAARPVDDAPELLKGKQVIIRVGPGHEPDGFVAGWSEEESQNRHEFIPLVRQPEQQTEDHVFLLQGLGQMWVAGVRIEWSGYYAEERRCRIPLPTYPFAKRRFAIDLPVGGLINGGASTRREVQSNQGDNTGGTSDQLRVLTVSAIEQIISDIVKEHFGFTALGVNDNLFEIGASSLDVSQIAEKLTDTLGQEIPVVSLYTYPSARALAGHLSGKTAVSKKPSAKPSEVKRGQVCRPELNQTGSESVRTEDDHGQEIAVIGMAGRFPGADNLEEFWRNLSGGVESITFFTDEELIAEGIDPQLIAHPSYVKARGTLNGYDQFDAAFFGYSAREAELMDPQLRLFHECAWEALEAAGYNPDTYSGSIGVYAGATPNLEWISRFAAGLGGTERFSAMLLNDREFFSTQLSYKLNLRGPSISMQTACSTSLVNIVMASQALLAGSCDIALAGGSTVTVPHKSGYMYEEGMIQSPDGHCRAFDEKAAGTVFGDGVGVVILKRLHNAIEDGDVIHAVIKGFGLNNDGTRKVGFTAPSTKGQADVIRAAQQMAGIAPESITYVEAHGTGTPMGDPIEIEALKEAFQTAQTGFCRIGSVKSNVGHLNSAAGAAGFIKTVLALKERQIPPTLHFERANSKINFDNSPFIVNSELTPWENEHYPLRSGVSSFGIGGTNAHVILEEAPFVEASDAGREDKLLLLSARTPTALQAVKSRLAEYLVKRPDANLADVAYTLQVGRKAFEWRTAFLCKDVQEVVDILNSSDSGVISEEYTGMESRSIVFMFPGQGSQYVNMGRGLYLEEPVFRKELDHCMELAQSFLEFDLSKVLFEDDPAQIAEREELLKRTDIAQPVLFIMEYALARLLMHWGVTPEAMLGHSIGEYTAACLAGVFKLEEALELVALRGRLMRAMAPGSMLSVAMPEDELLASLPEGLDLAAVNSSALCVVAGETPKVEAFARHLDDKGIGNRLLHTSHAFHSYMMEPMLDEFASRVRTLSLEKPVIPFMSNVTGTWITAEQAVDAAYWVQHLRSTVRFADGLDELLSQPRTVFVEVGPGNALSTFVRKHIAASRERVVVNVLRHPQETTTDSAHLLQRLGKLWTAGAHIDWASYYQHERRKRVELPTYPMERQRFWLENTSSSFEMEHLTGARANGSGSGKNPNMEEWFYYPGWKRAMLNHSSLTKPYHLLIFADHCLIAEALAQRAKEEGHRIAVVQAGTEFKKLENDVFTIAPEASEHYIQLLEELGQQKFVPDQIVHLWNVTSEEADSALQYESKLDWEQQKFGYYSLIYLAQALNKQKEIQEVRLAVVSTNMQEVTGQERLAPGKITLLGPCMVIQQEYSSMTCVSIDIDLPNNERRRQRMASQLLAELAAPAEDRLIAYRGSYRWVQDYKPMTLRESNSGEQNPFREGGVYLITGGLGGIGMLTAQYLAQHFKAKLILTGRSSFPAREEYEHYLSEYGEKHPLARKIRNVQQLEQFGAEVTYVQADLAEESDMISVFEFIESQYGCLNGVVQAAGLPGGESFRAIENIGGTQLDEQFNAKVKGLQILSRFIEEKKPDICVLFSSIASVLGGLGFSAYSAANLYMDAFARRQNQASDTKWLCINWDAWEFWEEHRSTIGETLVELAITPAEAPMLFNYVYAPCDSHQIIVSTGNLQARIDQWIYHAGRKQENNRTTTTYERPDLTSAYVAPRNQIEKAIAEVWKQFFRMDQVGIHDNFFDLGASSLDMIQVTGKINEALNESLAVVDMFTYPTIHALAQRLGKSEAMEAEEAEMEHQLIDTVAKGKKRQQEQRKKRRKGEVLQ